MLQAATGCKRVPGSARQAKRQAASARCLLSLIDLPSVKTSLNTSNKSDKPQIQQTRSRMPLHTHVLAFACAGVVGALVFALPSEESSEPRNRAKLIGSGKLEQSIPLPEIAGDTSMEILSTFIPERKITTLIRPQAMDETSERAITPKTQHQSKDEASEQALIPEVIEIPAAAPIIQESAPNEPIVAETMTVYQDWRETEVEPGETLSHVFARLGMSLSDMHNMLNALNKSSELNSLRPGQTLKLLADNGGKLKELVLTRSKTTGVKILREGESYVSESYELPVDTDIAYNRAVITNSLYQSADTAGLPDKTIMEMAEIFGWDVDFALDIRPGDHYTVVYEEQLLSGEKIGVGNILSAEFSNQNREFQAVRFTNENDVSNYYTPDGKSMRQAFLRSPVDFRRISSHFQGSRKHPIHGFKRPHRGVDYAAATGTPIKASGDGRVAFVGRKGGYGRTIVLQHPGGYTTLYAHMSAYAKSLKKGQYVSQGDSIGYVGMSGTATGPHLHYEFRVNGTHVNPVTVKLPNAQPIDPRYAAEFAQVSAERMAMLNQHKLALANN